MKSWVRLPMDVIQRDDLTAADKILYAIIIDRCDYGRVAVQIDQPTLARMAGCSVRTVRRSVERLEESGLIQIRAGTGRADVIQPQKLLPDKKKGEHRRPACVPEMVNCNLQSYYSTQNRRCQGGKRHETNTYEQ